MAMIVPTVDSVGDAALTNSIIDKSIAEIQDDLVTDIREHAFYNCTALKKAVFGSVSDVDDRAFDGCTALTTVDFHTSTPFGDYVFNNCSALTALILRGATVCHAISGTLQNSGIASGNGYVYVPAALLDAYKAHSVWGQYANQIRAIEEWTEMCDPYSWEGVAVAIEKGTYKNVYKIGDSVPVDLGSDGVINMQIAAFDADTLADGSGTAAISWIGKDLTKTKQYFSSGTATGWKDSPTRSYLSNTIKPLFPSSLSGVIQTVSKTQEAVVSGSLAADTTSDDVWIPSRNELNGGIYKELFPDNASRVKCRTDETSNQNWATRSLYSTTNSYYVYTNGAFQNRTMMTQYNMAIGFCTGKSK